MHRTGSTGKIYFPSYKKLQKYLPDQKDEINKYAKLISDIGSIEIFRIEENRKCQLALNLVEANAEKFCGIIDEIVTIKSSS